MKPILELHNVSKKFMINHEQQPYLSLRESISNVFKPTSTKEEFWALNDISFSVNQGDTVGIIGKNGAGKSTLLKILSKITPPTSGKIIGRGRIASLLEVGTGFHPELSGRENVLMNGSILGMRRAEILSNFDAIVDFAGVDKFIDTPLKHYSSGMQLRLAFAVAAFLENEILIIDEVLAVGDAEFQKKCMGKMGEVSKNGKTLLFVSHNIAAVKSLCTQAVVLEKGTIKTKGKIDIAVAAYLNEASEMYNRVVFDAKYAFKEFTLHEINIKQKDTTEFCTLDEYDTVELNTKISICTTNFNLDLTYVLRNEYGEPLFTFTHAGNNMKLNQGLNNVKCIFPKGYFNIGTYYLAIYIIKNAKETIYTENDILVFNIQEGQRPIGAWMGREPGFIKPIFDWSIT
jgi:lipopolysaccharide transport system ATP-binding protein